MKVKFFGTRGSIPICRADSVQYGGNTTSLRIFSDCLPQGHLSIIDGGTGLKQLCKEALASEDVKSADLFFTHWHSDHTNGFTGSDFIYSKKIKMRCWGPVENNMGPKEILESLMQPPVWPTHHKNWYSHVTFNPVEHPLIERILYHPQGGVKRMNAEQLERLLEKERNIPIGKGMYPLSECLVVSMLYSEHPQRTISYRFREMPTNKVFVFLTDHENTDGLPLNLREHARGADLLAMDSQYSRQIYDDLTAGRGHGTPDYCARFAFKVGAKRLALTHHDPDSTDQDVNRILDDCRRQVSILRQYRTDLDRKDVFACHDYEEFEI